MSIPLKSVSKCFFTIEYFELFTGTQIHKVGAAMHRRYLTRRCLSLTLTVMLYQPLGKKEKLYNHSRIIAYFVVILGRLVYYPRSIERLIDADNSRISSRVYLDCIQIFLRLFIQKQISSALPLLSSALCVICYISIHLRLRRASWHEFICKKSVNKFFPKFAA